MTVDEHEGPLFEIKQTAWGGRACFAKEDIPKGTRVLEIDDYTGSCVSYEFRKEVCCYCYAYSYGKTMKFKLDKTSVESLIQMSNRKIDINMKKFQGAGLWFCSEECCGEFLHLPNIIDLIESYEILLTSFHSMLKRHNSDDDKEAELNSVTISKEIIDSQWDKITKSWILSIEKIKSSKRLNKLPVISEDEYSCCRFVCSSLYRLSNFSEDSLTMKSFQHLQSNELEKISKFPILLHFQESVFNTLYILLPNNLKCHLSTDSFRHILGSEYANSFGLWQEDESLESRECYGYWVLPRASYFNHSCDPNITKTRNGRIMDFILNRDVKVGEELSINYAGTLNLPLTERREFMRNGWFFDCGCQKCLKELSDG
ncbi:hypothetical protein KAFR_0H02340 [Kazachstania africana CBS 2517]|uniref:SET domain-containing protein n=1 Tax=Kazachstania africana (strain ATCC 22294 / BCRC 22015 / CBS 2517 / CECT 1963 / NBRC 1671 / NRRL Y-8276) TaxID=1071382 RepID=H2AZ87_KAZAF|nr:hypothetical protein KAFR_0H02340 [Kazachstania africana CBS 2517]CCF59643.1 hypothetical protein KAFR_0H02340 [Kazachstania africana CBS 2517]